MNDITVEATTLNLSIEELALIFSLIGQAPLAKTMLTDGLGELNADELRGRIMAASNSLLAKGVFRLDGDTLEIEPSCAGILGPMINADYALQCTAFGAEQPSRSVMFYVQGKKIVEHRAQHGFYHRLIALENVEVAVDSCEEFFQFQEFDDFEAMPFVLNQEQVREARLLDEETAAGVRERLEQQGADAETAELFTDDLRDQQQWSVVLRLHTVPDEGVLAEVGYEALAGASGRTWLLTVDGESDSTAALHVRPAERDTIRSLTQALLTPIDHDNSVLSNLESEG